MKKLLLLAVTLISAVILHAQDPGLIRHVPGDVDYLGQANLKELGANPKLRDFIEANDDQKVLQFKDDLKRSGIDVYSSFSHGVFYYSTKNKKGGAVLKTNLGESAFNSLIEGNISKTGGKLNRNTINGKTVYTLENRGGKSSYAYLKPDVIGVSELPEDVGILVSVTDKTSAAANAKLMDYSGKVSRNSIIWMVFDAKDSFLGIRQKHNSGEKKGMQQMFPIDNIQGGFMNMNLTGPSRDNLSLDAHINCKDKGKAQLLALQIQAMVLTYIPMLSHGDNRLSEALMDAVKFSNDGNDIVVRAEISSALQEQLKRAAANPVSSQHNAAGKKKESK